MDFGRPNVEIGQKMANGQLLFLALTYMYSGKLHTFPLSLNAMECEPPQAICNTLIPSNVEDNFAGIQEGLVASSPLPSSP